MNLFYRMKYLLFESEQQTSTQCLLIYFSKNGFYDHLGYLIAIFYLFPAKGVRFDSSNQIKM